MTDKEWIMLITMGVYMVAMVAIGVYYSHKNKNTDDYFLGGRKLGPVVTAMSAEASDMSGWLLMGLPGVAYACGIAEAPWTAIGLAIGTYLNWLLVAKRLRRYTVVADNSITLPDFFSNRFKDKSKILMCVSAVIILIFFVPYTASGFSTCGKLFSSLFGVDYQIAMIISAVVIVAYTAGEFGSVIKNLEKAGLGGIIPPVLRYILYAINQYLEERAAKTLPIKLHGPEKGEQK